MGGPEIGQGIAATRSGIRIQCMSGYTEDAVVRHGLVKSGVAFLQKPLTPERLARKVREVLDGAWPPERAIAPPPWPISLARSCAARASARWPATSGWK